MNRRILLKQLGLLAGAAIVLPHCTSKETVQEATISLHHLKPTGDQQRALTVLVDALIPKTDTPGARDLGVQDYVWRMIDDCTSAEDQKKFMDGLDQLAGVTYERFGKSIPECAPDDLKTILQEMNNGKLAPATGDNNIPNFYNQFRGYTIRGFLGSESVMTNVFHYNMIPGRFIGVVEITDPHDLKTILG
jgi:Gluconate 2-dehydrogenase subunit 3